MKIQQNLSDTFLYKVHSGHTEEKCDLFIIKFNLLYLNSYTQSDIMFR